MVSDHCAGRAPDVDRPVVANRLVASFYTISGAPVGQPARHSFLDRVRAASAAGSDALGLMYVDTDALIAGGQSAAELRTIADDHGIGLDELEFLNGWWAEGERGLEQRRAEGRLYEVAAAFGSRHINVGVSARAEQAPPYEVLVERFASLCDRAAEHGLLIGLEYMPFFVLADAPRAWGLVQDAERANGGLVVDAFHQLLGPSPLAALREIPPERIVAVQLCDVPADSGLTLLEAAIGGRVWPGHGDLDVVGLAAELISMGVRAPVGVEVLSPAVQALGIEEATVLAADTTRSVLARGARATVK